MVGAHSFKRSPVRITSGMVTCTSNLRKKKMLSIYGRFPKRKSASISSRGTLPVLPFAHRHLSDIRLCPFGRTVHTKMNNVVIKRLRIPIVRPVNKLPSSLSHGIMCSLLASRLTFGKLVFASTLTVENMSNGKGIDLRTLRTNGSVMLTPHGLGTRIPTILTTIRGNRLDQRSVRDGYHGMLACGCTLKLDGGGCIRLSNLRRQIGDPRTHSLIHQLGLTTVAILGGGSRMLPLRASGSRGVTLLRMNSPNRARTLTGRVAHCTSLIHFHLHPGRARRRGHQLCSSLTVCGQIMMTIDRRHLTSCRPFFAGFTPSTPIICLFFAPNGVVLRVRHTIDRTSTMILTRDRGASVRHRITSILFTGTATSKELSTDLNKLFRANTKIAVAPGAPLRFMPRRCNLSSISLGQVSSITLSNVQRKTCPNYRMMIVGGNRMVISGTFNARAKGKDTHIRSSSVCSLTSLAGAATALLTIVGLCSGKHFGLASGVSSCLPFLRHAGGGSVAVRRVLCRRSNLPS